MLSQLLRDLHLQTSKRVVLLIDDGDKPFRNKLNQDNLKDIHRFLLSFYIITKDSDKDIKFSMIKGYYASVIYAYFALLGFEIIAEDVTNLGRIDLTLIIRDKIYIIEFKVGNENALNQIKQKEYHKKYISQDKEIILIGINFDKDKRNIGKVEFEEIK